MNGKFRSSSLLFDYIGALMVFLLTFFLFGPSLKVDAQEIEPSRSWSIFDTINYNDIHSMEEALKNPNIPFLTEEEAIEQIYRAPNTYAAEAIVKKTRIYLQDRIKELRQVVDTDIHIQGLAYKSKRPLRVQLLSNRLVQLATMPASVRLSGTHIYPPSGYQWVMYIRRSNGQEYTENYSVRKVVNGEDAFCIQPGVPIGSTYYSNQNGNLSEWQKEVMKSIITAYREFGGFTNDVTGYQRWLAAQILIWENSNEVPQYVRITPQWVNGVNHWKSELAARANVIRVVPRFDGYERTVTQGVTAGFTEQEPWGEYNLHVSSVTNGGRAYVSGPYVYVDTTNATGSQIVVTLVKGIDPAHDYPFYYWNGSGGFYQTLVSGYTNTKVKLVVNVNRSASVVVHKTGDIDTEGLSNTEFSLYRSDGSFVTKGMTDSDGNLKFNDLQYGDYYVQESKATPGYQLNNTPYRFTLNSSYSESNPYRVNVQNTYALSATETVSDVNEADVSHNTWSASNNDFLQYKVKTNVIAKPNDSYLRTFSIEGNVDRSVVDVQRYQVFDQNGVDVTSKFNITNDSTKVVASAKTEALNSNDFYNKSYSLVIRMSLKSDRLNSSNKQNIHIVKNGMVKAKVTNEKVAQTNDVSTDLYVRNVTVRHIERDSNVVLKTTNDLKYEGEHYHYEPEKILSPDGFDYKSSTILDGTVGNQDVQLTIPYVLPAYNVDVDSIQIDTAKVSSGYLPTKLTFKHNTMHSDIIGDISFFVIVTDVTNKKDVYRNEYFAKSFKDMYDIQLPVNYLSKNQKVDYAVSIKLAKNPKNDKFVTSTTPLASYGFTASEKNITNSDVQNNAFHYSAVVRTFKNRTNPVREYREQIDGSLDLTYKTKTGYGIKPRVTMNYANDLNETYDLRLNLQFPKSFVTKDDHIDVVDSSNGYQLIMDKNNQLPKMYVKKDTGAIYSSKFVGNTSEFVDGGFKLYIPVWHKLGEYPISYTFHNGSIGKNAISLNLQSTIDIYAYMYVTSKSSTVVNDELMLRPAR